MADIIFFKKYIPLISLDGRGYNFRIFIIIYIIYNSYDFFKSYILKGGFRDGKAGVINAGMDAFYKFVTIAKIWENRIKKQDISKELPE